MPQKARHSGRDDRSFAAGWEAGREGGSGAAAHEATALGGPVHEAGEFVAVFPGEMEEFSGIEVSGFLAQEGFETPLEIGTVPGLEAVAPSGNPVVAERLPHGCILHGAARRPREKFVKLITEMLRQGTAGVKTPGVPERLGTAEEFRKMPKKHFLRG